MKHRLILATIVALAAALTFAAALVAAADVGPQPSCPAYYVVRWGDTLNKIAAAYRTTLSDLLRLNAGRVRHPDLIYAGQILCVPAERRVALQVTYHIKEGGDEAGSAWLARGGLLGRTAHYAVQSVALVSTTLEITSTFAAFPPALIGVRNQADASTYTLYVVGDGRGLLPLVLTDTQTLTTVLPVEPAACNTRRFSLLAAGLSDVATATLRMEAGNSDLPFALTRLARQETLERVLECIDEEQIGFAIAAAGPRYPDTYRVTMRLEGHIVGPPGATRALRCARWPVWGWFFRWLRSWYGC